MAAHQNSKKFHYITRQVLGCPVYDRGAIPRTLVQSNVVRSRLIILINEEINEANSPDKIVAKKKIVKKKIIISAKKKKSRQKKNRQKKKKKIVAGKK